MNINCRFQIVMDILSETQKPNQNRTKKTKTGPKVTKSRMVPIFLNPKKTRTEPRTERVPNILNIL